MGSRGKPELGLTKIPSFQRRGRAALRAQVNEALQKQTFTDVVMPLGVCTGDKLINVPPGEGITQRATGAEMLPEKSPYK